MSAKVTISVKFCKGCKLCLAACPRKALKLSGKRTHAGVEIVAWDPAVGCTACLLCAAMCPDAAITIEEDANDANGARQLSRRSAGAKPDAVPAEAKKSGKAAK